MQLKSRKRSNAKIENGNPECAYVMLIGYLRDIKMDKTRDIVSDDMEV
jgi:hypothetical protein